MDIDSIVGDEKNYKPVTFSIDHTTTLNKTEIISDKKKRGRPSKSKDDRRCHVCKTSTTPEWRIGKYLINNIWIEYPLCNACGLRYCKEQKKKELYIEDRENYIDEYDDIIFKDEDFKYDNEDYKISKLNSLSKTCISKASFKNKAKTTCSVKKTKFQQKPKPIVPGSKRPKGRPPTPKPDSCKYDFNGETCGAIESPEWRKYKPDNGKVILICNRCGLHNKKKLKLQEKSRQINSLSNIIN